MHTKTDDYETGAGHEVPAPVCLDTGDAGYRGALLIGPSSSFFLVLIVLSQMVHFPFYCLRDCAFAWRQDVLQCELRLSRCRFSSVVAGV